MSQPPRPERFIKIAAYAVGALLGLAALGVVLVPQAERLYAKGPANTGHEKLGCTDCHTQAPGTMRQQLQAKVQFGLGKRETNASFGHLPVDNKQCVACHARDEDAHPVHRFLEPRFAQAREEIGAQSCVACHREHTGVRSTMPVAACSTCHQDLAMKRDPLDVPHSELVAKKAWTTCLGCHDFHGNHRRVTQTRFNDTYSPAAIKAYLDGGMSPYGSDKKYPTKTGPR